MVNSSHDEIKLNFNITRRNSLAIGSIFASLLLEGCKFHDRHRIFMEFENSPNCYVTGTKILTPDGPKNIDDLNSGEPVIVSSGRTKAVRWVGRRRYSRRPHEDWPDEVKPVRIARGALREGLPNADLYVSQNHRLYLDGMLIRAADLINESSIAVDSRATTVSLEYLHVLVEGDHDIIFAQGAPSETLLFDTDVLRQFDNFCDLKDLPQHESHNSAATCAPVYDYGSCGRLDMLCSHFRSALSPFVDRRNPADKVRDVLMNRRLGAWRGQIQGEIAMGSHAWGAGLP
jgi:hypothetical protein